MTSRALVITSLLLLSWANAFGQTRGQAPQPTNQYEIRGKLMFAMATPPDERIEVFLERNMQRIQTAFTDSLGQFEFRGLSPGNYTISVRHPGFEDVHQTVEVFNMQRTVTLSIPMQPTFVVRRTRPGGFEGDDSNVIDVNQLKSLPKKAIQEYEKALGETRKGETLKTVKHLEEAIKLAPNFYHAHNNLGVAYVKLERYRDAEKHYRRARELNPNADQPLLNLAMMFIAESDLHREEGRHVYGKLLDAAMDNLDEAIKMRPSSAPAHFYLGTAYYKSDFLSEAEASLKKAGNLDPKMPGPQLMLINVYVKQKRWKDVISQIDVFLKDNPRAEERPRMQELRQKLAKELSIP